MNINEAFPGSYLKADDLKGHQVPVQIDRLVMDTIGDEHKPVLYFRGKERGLVLNKTNANMIIELLGTAETDEWTGQAIGLFPTKVDFQGRRVNAIRIYSPNGDEPKLGVTAPPPAPAPVAPVDPDDDIPF